MGYHEAGFEVVGVDIVDQPHYPFEFYQADALEILSISGSWDRYDAIHASPPCQWGTAYRRRPGHVNPSENLVEPVRKLLQATGLPWVIEQPESNRAALNAPITLCGSSFGLDVRRHRCFESNVSLTLSLPCRHDWQTPRFAPATNRSNLRKTVEVGVWRIPLDVQKRAMGVDWEITRHELSEAIPPKYTELLGKQLLVHCLAAAPDQGDHRGR